METQALRADLAAATEQIHVLTGALDEMKTEFRLYKLRPENFASRLQQLYLSGEPAVPQRTRPSARRVPCPRREEGGCEESEGEGGGEGDGVESTEPRSPSSCDTTM